MKRKLTAFTLALCLCLGLALPAGAAGVEELFPGVNPYNGYTDVPDDQWYAADVRICTEVGLLNGFDNRVFAPDAAVPISQAAAIAARIKDILDGGDGQIDSPTGPWYTEAISRMQALARAAGEVRLLSRLSYPDDSATRYDFFGFIALVAGEDLLAPINSVTTLPDTDDPRVLAFYNAGILDGLDPYGTFGGDLPLRRCEAAAIAARLVRPGLRLTVNLTPLPDLCQAAGVLPGTVWFQGDKAVTALEYLTAAVEVIRDLEVACAQQGIEFNWNNTADGVTFVDTVKSETLEALGVTKDMATEAFGAFDLQSFYSRYLDLAEG